MLVKSIIVLSLAVLGQCDIPTTPVLQCTEREGELPLHVYVDGCDGSVCSLPQLQDASVNVVFRADRFLSSMRTLADAFLTVGWVTLPVPYDLQQDSYTCNFLQNTYCPVQAGEVVQYNLKMYIESFFPVGTNAAIEFRVVDQNSNPVFCFRMNIRITSPITEDAAIAADIVNTATLY